MKYKVGDKVKVRSDLKANRCYGLFVVNDMAKMRGKTVTIKAVSKDDYRIEELHYYWTDEMFEDIEVKNKFKKGQTVKIKRTGKIGKIAVVCNDDYYKTGSSNRAYGVDYAEDLSWFTVHDLEEVQEILDDVEKEYLKAVIKPFRNEVTYINKSEARNNTEFICIRFKKDLNICFPDFKKGSMYKGMKSEKIYTLEELGL